MATDDDITEDITEDGTTDQMVYLVESARKALGGERALLMIQKKYDTTEMNLMSYAESDDQSFAEQTADIFIMMLRNLQAVMKTSSSMEIRLYDKTTGKQMAIPRADAAQRISR